MDRRFQDFYQRSLKPLCRHLQALGLRQDEELEDVLQSTFLEALKTFDGLKDPDAALGWLFTIGRRQYARYVAGRVRHRELFVGGKADEPSTTGDGADARAQCRQVLELMQETEDPVRRRALQLFFLEDQPLKEIAAQTSTNVSTLTTWISRFRKQVQDKMAPMDQEALPSKKRRAR